MNPIKPGYKTTEFWVSIIGEAATLLTSISGTLDPKTAAYVTGIIGGLYAISRGLAKQNPS